MSSNGNICQTDEKIDACKKMYMAVTADRFELPVAVAESTEELGRIFGASSDTILTYISKGIINKSWAKGLKFVRVDYTENKLSKSIKKAMQRVHRNQKCGGEELQNVGQADTV